MKLKNRIITEQENYFAIQFRESELMFQFENDEQKKKQYEKANLFLDNLNKDNKTD